MEKNQSQEKLAKNVSDRKSTKNKNFAKQLLSWFATNGRDLPWRKKVGPYKILVVEKLLQQTDVAHVMKVYNDFFKKYPTLSALDNATKSEIEKTIKPLGFWRIRSRDFKLMAKQLLVKHVGKVPSDKKKLLKLSGVGQYIANAVRCFGFGKQEAVVDVNVRRIAKRIFFWTSDLPNDAELAKFMKDIIPAKKAKQFNWALLDFASAVCTRKPHCEKCFANEFCEYFQAINENNFSKNS